MNIRRTASLSLAIASALVSLCWVVWWVANDQVRSVINDLVLPLFAPALVVAMYFSPASHGPSAIAWFVSQVVQLFLMIFAVVWLIAMLRASSAPKSLA